MKAEVEFEVGSRRSKLRLEAGSPSQIPIGVECTVNNRNQRGSHELDFEVEEGVGVGVDLRYKFCSNSQTSRYEFRRWNTSLL